MGKPASVDSQRAKRFLRELADAPFVALVFDEDDIRVYTKGLDPDHMAAVSEFVEQFSPADEVGA